MESHSQNKNQTTKSAPVCEWSVEFQCIRINGILAPSPISMVPLKTELGNHEVQPESSTKIRRLHMHGSPSSPKEEHEPESNKKKRTTAGDEELFFRLFKFPNNTREEYLLEMHEAKTGSNGVVRSRLIVHESDGKWKIETCGLEVGNHVVIPLVEDSSSPPKFPKKYNISLQERLRGWTMEKRKRSNGKEDKFYYHGGRQFRSYIEVAAFLLYSTRLKDLKNITTTQEKKAMIELSSSSNNHGNSSGTAYVSTSPQVQDGGGKNEDGEEANPSIDYGVCCIFNPQSITEIIDENKNPM